MRRGDTPFSEPDIACLVCGYPIDTPYGYSACDVPFCSEECAEEHILDYEGYEYEEAEEKIESIRVISGNELHQMIKDIQEMYREGLQ